MPRYPIIFGLRDRVEGNGFVAGVIMEGRALIHEEEGYVWVEGVNPGGFAGAGSNPAEAIESFRREYTAALYDIADEARTFEEFERQVREFFDNAGETPMREWDEAVMDVRAGRVSADWMNRRPADSPRGVKVVELRQATPQNNEISEGAALAA